MLKKGTIAICGYKGVGKTTLFNFLCNADAIKQYRARASASSRGCKDDLCLIAPSASQNQIAQDEQDHDVSVSDSIAPDDDALPTITQAEEDVDSMRACDKDECPSIAGQANNAPHDTPEEALALRDELADLALYLDDLQGAGTASVPTSSYFDKFKLGQYSLVIIVLGNRIQKVDLDVFSRCRSRNVPCVIVRMFADSLFVDEGGVELPEAALQTRIDEHRNLVIREIAVDTNNDGEQSIAALLAQDKMSQWQSAGEELQAKVSCFFITNRNLESYQYGDQDMDDYEDRAASPTLTEEIDHLYAKVADVVRHSRSLRSPRTSSITRWIKGISAMFCCCLIVIASIHFALKYHLSTPVDFTSY